MLAVALTPLVWAFAARDDEARDGAWWQRTPREERLGYLAGYLDCEVADAGQSVFAQVSWYTLEPKIKKRYASGLDAKAPKVWTVMKEIAAKEPRNPLDKAGEHYPGKHGIFDGEYWRQSEPEHRLGFVEGYVDCLRNEVPEGARFSRPARIYVGRLSGWFGIQSGDPGEIRADRADSKIAHTLRLFRDE